MVAVKDKIARIPPRVDYDHMSDVLYVSLGKPIPDEGEDQPRGVIFRFAITGGSPSGVTVVGFRHNGWDKNLTGLSDIVGKHLNIDSIGVLRALQNTLKE